MTDERECDGCGRMALLRPYWTLHGLGGNYCWDCMAHRNDCRIRKESFQPDVHTPHVCRQCSKPSTVWHQGKRIDLCYECFMRAYSQNSGGA